jgi:hypothetical protein
MRGSVLLGGMALAALAFAPVPVEAALFQTAQPAKSATLSFKATRGIFTGQWAYQTIAISGNPKTSLARMSLGGSEFTLAEEGGKITGTRPAGKGKTYPVEGFAVYGSRQAPTIVLHSVSVVNGKSYEYDYFGYLMPAWSVTASQPDTFMGTVVRTDPAAPGAPAIVASFIATREGTAAGK